MNLFIEKYMPLLVILAIPTCTVFAMSMTGLTCYLTDRVNMSDRTRGIVLTIAIVGSFAAFFFITAKLYDHFNNGKLTDLFILRSAGETRLLLWNEMEDMGGAGMITLYANRFKLYDLSTGKPIHQTFLNRRADWNDYTIYGPFPDGRAWSYSSDTGLSLLDLFEATVLLDEDEILKRLPELGERIRISADRPYDSKTDAIFVTTPDGEIHRILPDDLGKTDREVDWLYTYPYRERIDLPEDLSEGNVYTSLPWNDEKFVFVTIKGYTLSALRIDPATGKILGRFDYFD